MTDFTKQQRPTGLQVGDEVIWQGQPRKIVKLLGIDVVLEGVDDVICLPMDAARIDTFAEPLPDVTTTTTVEDAYFGLCPICHKSDGYANAGRSHRFYCKEHKTSWLFGSNIFSDWRWQTKEQQRAIWDEIGLDDFTTVKPYHPDRPPDGSDVPF
jgi:hypothetical protein